MKYHNLKDINNNVPKAGSFKHFLRIQENGGRVVKGVNTTADVGTDGIKKQAAKFGNTVDKDGRPPTLSKKVKGSKTNVLFNLGMSESVDNTHESVLYYSKMAENLGELASTSKVYVDMDGVLADFFGEWQKLIGSDWRKVKDIEPALQKIRDKDNFWLDLPLLPQAKNLLGIIKKVKGSYTILSSPLPNDPNSEPHKREWIKKNLDFFPPENVIITHDKPKYAVNSDGTPNILIDDFGKNIASWEAAGGEGFKHKDHKFERTAKAIKQHMSEPVEEAPEDKINKKIVQKAQGMMKPMYSSEIAAMVEDEFEAIREAALKRYKKSNGKIDLYTAYTMAIEDEFPEIPNPIFVFQYMTDPVDPNHQDIVPQEAEDGSWADRADKEYQQNPKDGGFDGKIKGRWFAIKADRDSYMDQGMEPEDALDKAAERHGVDPEEVEKWIAAGNAVKIKERKLTKGEEKKKEKNVKGMKKNKDDFEKRYGKESKAVMYATATKMAKESLLWSIETGQDLNESIDKIIQVLEEMDRRQFMKTAGKVGAGLGAAALYSALPTPVKAMTKDSKPKPKIIMHTSIGREFDLSDRANPAKAILDMYAKIEKIYVDRGETLPQVWVTLDGKQVWAPAGSIPNANKTLWTKEKAKKSNDREAKINKEARAAWDNGERLSTQYNMHLIKFRHRYKESIDENFADGKVKGKSKPGRVKKSGASCSSSVTELRKKAKNASGERAKMYHWCANMKSGQAKK